MTTVGQSSEEYLRLIAYVEVQPPGKLLSYLDAAQETGVRMDVKGKDKLRRAILHLNREYSVMRGVGYQLADAKSAVGILGHKVLRIDKAVKRADRAQRVVQQQFLDKMDEGERNYVLFHGAALGAIIASTSAAKRLYQKDAVKIQPPTISLPPMN